MKISWIGVCCVVLLAIYAVLLGRVIVSRQGRLNGIKPLIDPFMYFLAVRPIADRMEPLLIRPRYALAQLNGGTCSRDRLLLFAGESVGLGYAAWLAFGCVSWVTDNESLAVLGMIVSCCVPLLRARELRNRVATRRQRIVMELPELLGKLLLIVNAGDTVLRALTRCVEHQPLGSNPLYDELKSALVAMKRGESMAVALEEMGRRCAVPEVKLFASTLLINARRGGEVFVPALRELTRQMWEKRKAAVRTLGEQASSKLVFPLALIFLCIMILVGAPAMLMF